MNTTLRQSATPLAIAATLLAWAGAGCTSSNPAHAVPKVEVAPALALVEATCPISGEPVTELDEIAYFGSFPVYCKGRDNARQFAALPVKQRSRLASEQVLAQKGIANAICPVTGETLDADAAAVVYEGRVIGFASSADANQFRSLKPEKKAKVIAAWEADEAAAQGERAADA